MDKTFIEKYEVGHSLCDKIIDFFHKNLQWHREGMVGYGYNKKFKDSIDLSIPINELQQINPFTEIVLKCAKDYVKKYIEDCEKNKWSDYEFVECVNIQYYEPKKGYPARHHERDCFKASNRCLVYMLYLTDTPNAGTHFVHYGHTTECVKGDLIIWPPDFTHIHNGIVSNTHEKIIITGWLGFTKLHTGTNLV